MSAIAASEAAPLAPMVRMRWVTKRYRDHLVLGGIDLVVLRGEAVFIVGQSGAGKSTLLRLLNRDLKPSQGEIFIDGTPVHSMRRRKVPDLRRQVGTVYQDIRLLPRLTARENVAFAVQVQDLSVSEREAKARADGMLEVVGLTGAGHAYPEELSGGEQQRVAIARALVTEPQLLLADEPTGNLDPRTSLGIMTLLANLTELGRSVLVVTHKLEVVRRLGRRVLVLEDGRLVAEHERDGEHWTDDQDFEPNRATEVARLREDPA